MRVHLASLAGALLVPLLLRGVARADDPAPTVVTDKEHDFEWTVPAGWTVSDPPAADKEQGYHAKAKRVVAEGAEAIANVFVKPAGETSLETFASIVKENKKKVLTEPEETDEAASWAGSDTARAITILGKAENGSAVRWIVRAAIFSGNYHQVSVMATNSAAADIGSEIDALLAGYRVLSAPAPSGGDGGTPGEAGVPLKKQFPKLGLSWALPAPGKKSLPPVKEGDEPREFTWGFLDGGNPNLDKLQAGTLATAVLSLGTDVIVSASLELPKTSQQDIPPAGIVKNDHNFEGLEKAFDGTPVPNVDEDCEVGNARGASRTVSGKNQKDGRPLWIRFYFVTLQRQLYLLRLEAADGWQEKERDWVRSTVKGLAWADTTMGIRGPVAAPFASASEARGNGWIDFNTKRKNSRGNLTWVKPPQFGELKKDGAEGWVFAAEARKPGAYLFVGVSRKEASLIGKGTPPFSLESMIDEFEGTWKNEFENSNTRGKSEKSNRKDATFRGAKGFSYEFRGTKTDVPFVERGWVVKTGPDIFWIRCQFGGKDAEKTMDPDWKDFQGSITFK